MKKLVIKEIPDKNGEITQIQIVEQSNVCNKFGENKTNNFIASNKFILYSLSYPETYNDSFYTRGDDTSLDLSIIKVPSKKWLEDMRIAVKEYNDYFSNCNDCTDRKCNSCIIDKERNLNEKINY